MFIPAIHSNLYSYAFQGAAIAAPSILSSAIRPKILDHQSSKTYVWTYFTLGVFLPTLGLLHWHGFARKTSVISALILTGLAKTLSDPKPPVGPAPFRHRHKPPPPQEPSRELVPLSHNQAPRLPIIPAPFYHQVNLEAEALAKTLIPGDYTIREDEDTLIISDPHIAQAFKMWAGKKDREDLTLKDLTRLKAHVRYRDLQAVDRTEIRRSLYASLFPHVTAEPTVIPFLTGYGGQPVSVYREEGTLVFDISWLSYVRFMKIQPDGSVALEIYHDKPVYTSCIKRNTQEEIFKDPNPDPLKKVHKRFLVSSKKGTFDFELQQERVLALRYDNENPLPTHKAPEVIFEDQTIKFYFEHPVLAQYIGPYVGWIGSINKLLHFGPAHLELILFKQGEIEDFLKMKDHFPASQVFENCYQLLTSFQRSLPKETSSSTALVETEPRGRTSFQFGPIWSPVAASEDSYFVWTITQEEDNVVTLELEKKAAGRGMCGGVAERRVILKKGMEEGVLTVDIVKSGHNDLESYSSTSSYRLEKISGGLAATPLGKETASSHLPLFVGMTECHYESSGLQVPKELQEDMGFLVKVFSTLSDIQKSPDTIVVDKENQVLRTLEGAPLPHERIRQLSRYNQGWIGAPFIFHHETLGIQVGYSFFGTPLIED